MFLKENLEKTGKLRLRAEIKQSENLEKVLIAGSRLYRLPIAIFISAIKSIAWSKSPVFQPFRTIPYAGLPCHE